MKHVTDTTHINIFKHFLKHSTKGSFIYTHISLIVLISLRYMGGGGVELGAQLR